MMWSDVPLQLIPDFLMKPCFLRALIANETTLIDKFVFRINVVRLGYAERPSSLAVSANANITSFCVLGSTRLFEDTLIFLNCVAKTLLISVTLIAPLHRF